MLSKLLVTLCLTLLALQQAATVTALPTRGSMASLQRRAQASKRAQTQVAQPANLAKRAGPSQRLAKRQEAGPSQLANRAKAAHSEQPKTKNANQKRAANIASYVAALGRRAAEDANIVAALSATPAKSEAFTVSAATFLPTVIPAPLNNNNPKAFLRQRDRDAVKAAAIGHEFSLWQQAAGAAATPTSSTWVAAANVVLPSAVAPTPTLALLRKRMVPHPGAPTGTIKINVVGGEQKSAFTLINATRTDSATEKVAETSKVVKIIQNNTLPTVTRTLTFTAPEFSSHTATVTLVPTLLPNATDAAYVPVSPPADGADCSLPLNATTSGNSTVTLQCGKNTVEINVDVDVDVAIDASSVTKTKRNVIAFFEAPEKKHDYSRDVMLSDDWEDCTVGLDEGCFEVPEF